MFASAVRAIVKSGIGRAILQIAACATGVVPICVAAAAGLTLAAGGSLKDALFAAAFSFAQIGVYSFVGGIVQSVAGTALAGVVKLGLHAAVGGAFSVAQGGSFVQGAITGAISAGTSLMMEGTALGNIPGDEGVIARTAVAALAGGTASVLSGGKFANGAITGAMGHLFNYEASNAEHLRCKGQCHGYAGEPGRPMTSGEEKGLHALTFAATIGNPLAALRSMLSGSVTLYRAVSVAELEQLITTGVFKAGSNSGGFGKHFASTAEDAASWGNAMDGPNNFHVVAVEFPKGLPKVEQYWNRLDGIGPAYHIELGPLNAAKPNISQVRVPAP